MIVMMTGMGVGELDTTHFAEFYCYLFERLENLV